MLLGRGKFLWFTRLFLPLMSLKSLSKEDTDNQHPAQSNAAALA